MADAIYVPKSSAKARQTPYGEKISLSFKVEELVAFATAHANAKGYLNLTLSARKEVGQWGDTHSLKLDTWTPTPRPQSDATGFVEPDLDELDRVGF